MCVCETKEMLISEYRVTNFKYYNKAAKYHKGTFFWKMPDPRVENEEQDCVFTKAMGNLP